MKKLILVLTLVIFSLSASAVQIVKEGKNTTLIFKSQTEMKQKFSFEKAKKAGYKIASVKSVNGKIVVKVVR